MYREIIAVCSEINPEHTNILCEQNVEFLNAKPGGKLGLTKMFVISSFIRNVRKLHQNNTPRPAEYMFTGIKP